MTQQTNPGWLIAPLTNLFALAMIVSLVGCSSLTSQESLAPPVQGVVHNHGFYKVIFAHHRKPTIFNGTLRANETVREALQASGAMKKFKSVQVDLARRVESGRVLKLPVQFDENGNVMEEWNYAIHPGDELLVRRAASPGMFDGVFKKAQGTIY